MPKTIEGKLSAQGLKVAIVVSRFNSFITERLLEGSIDAFTRLGANLNDIDVIKVPGSFELISAAKKASESKKFDGVICLGAVIRGDTSHNEYIADQVAKGIMHLNLNGSTPVTFGIITADELSQAIERAGSKHGNKGAEAALSIVETINVLKQL